MGKGNNPSAAAKKVAEKRALEVSEMAAASQIWPAPSTKPKHLQKLCDQGYLPDQKHGNGRRLVNTTFPILSRVKLCSLF